MTISDEKLAEIIQEARALDSLRVASAFGSFDPVDFQMQVARWLQLAPAIVEMALELHTRRSEGK